MIKFEFGTSYISFKEVSVKFVTQVEVLKITTSKLNSLGLELR
jgi:hypothetical protein